MKRVFAWVRYILLWLFSALLYFTVDGYFFFLILVLITLLPWISFFMMRLFTKRIKLTFECTQSGMQITYTSNTFLPLAIMKLHIHHKNIFYGDIIHQEVSFMSERNAGIAVNFDNDKSGKYESMIDTCVLYDLLGLFHKTLQMPLQTEKVCYPQPSFHYIKKQSANQDEIDGLHKSQQLGTDYELREYQPQDSLRYIHHKMSYKLSKIMIKQFQPEEHEHYSVYLDFTGSIEQCEEVLSLFYGYALDCLQAFTTIDAVWKDAKGINTMQITSEHDIKECLEMILSFPRIEIAYDLSQVEQADAILSYAGLVQLKDRG